VKVPLTQEQQEVRAQLGARHDERLVEGDRRIDGVALRHVDGVGGVQAAQRQVVLVEQRAVEGQGVALEVRDRARQIHRVGGRVRRPADGHRRRDGRRKLNNAFHGNRPPD
jgi:hypothetical protein